jgi:branched-chain amino acid transport system ATP-binding protein
MENVPALVLEDVSVRFGGLHALDSVSLNVAPETVHGVIGPNGSGKTTMLNGLCGFVRCSGQLKLFGRSLVGLAPHRRVALGLGRTFQNPKVGDDLSVGDLLRIGEYRRRVRPFWQEAFAPWLADAEAQQFESKAREILDELGISLPSLDVLVSSLPHGVVKMLDLARTLMGDPKVVLLDESTSGLNEVEIAVMREQLKRLRARKLTIVAIEHNVRFLTDVCDHVTVLDAGRRIADGKISEVLQLPSVVKAYMGDDTPFKDDAPVHIAPEESTAEAERRSDERTEPRSRAAQTRS